MAIFSSRNDLDVLPGVGVVMTGYVYSEKDWSWRVREMKRVVEIDPEFFSPWERQFIREQSATIRPTEKQAVLQNKLWEKARRR